MSNSRFLGPYKKYNGPIEEMKLGDVFESIYKGRLHFITYICPCGCSRFLSVPGQGSLLPEHWEISFDNDNLLSMKPSFVMIQGCKSHYFITNGRVDWC